MNQIKETNDRLYKLALELDNKLAERKMSFFDFGTLLQIKGMDQARATRFLSDLFLFGYVERKQINGKEVFKISYLPGARRGRLEKMIEQQQKTLEQTTEILKTLRQIRGLI
jgi:hypothetical protein